MVTNRYAPSIGGVQTYARRLAESLVATGVDVEVYTHRLDLEQPSQELTATGVTIHRFAPVVRHEHAMFSPALVKALHSRRSGGDVLHLHSVHDPITPAAAAVWKGPVVLSPHFHGTSQGAFRRALHIGYRRTVRRLASRADVTCCNSSAEAALLAERTGLDRSRILVIPSGIDVALLCDAPVAAKSATTRVVVAGRLVAYKRVDRIIEAMRGLVATHDLVVVGDGPELPRLRRLAIECGVSDIVEFVGSVSDAEVRSHLAAADVVCTASTLESQGIVPLEGLTVGAGVVLSDIPAHREIYERFSDRSALFGPDDASTDIARAIQSVSGIRQTPLPAGRLPDDWSSVAQKFLAAYETAAIKVDRRAGRAFTDRAAAV